MSLVKEYFELSTKYIKEYGQNTILLMQVGSFFEVYGKKDDDSICDGTNILEFSRICELNIVDKNVCAPEKVVMAGFKDIIIEKYLKKIQSAGFTAVVYTQDEKAKNTTRSLAGIFSPGTYFSTDNSELTNNISCIWVEFIENNSSIFKKCFAKKTVVVGIANIDIYTGKSSIFQFNKCIENKNHSPITYDELEKFISINRPSEVVIIHNLKKNIVQDIINFANIQSKKIHFINTGDGEEEDTKNVCIAKNCEKQIYQKEILQRFYPNKTADIEIFMQNFYENDFASQAFCFLLDFVYQHNPYLVNKISEPVLENCSLRLILANHSLKQLNMIDDNSFQGKYSSVCNMLNACVTPMGKRRFTYNLLNPINNVDQLEREYNIIEHFLSLDEIAFQNKLSSIKDISKWNRKMIMKKITPKNFYEFYNNLNIISSIHKTHVASDNILINYLSLPENAPNSDKICEYCDSIIQFLKKNFNIEMCKDLDDAKDFEYNFIQRGIYSDLDKETENALNSWGQIEAIRTYFNKLVSSQEKKSKSTEYVNIHETEKNNFSLITTKRRSLLLKNLLPSNPIELEYSSSFSESTKKFTFNCSPSEVDFIAQSSSNNAISCKYINELCKIINVTKIKIKELVAVIYDKIVEQIEILYSESLNTIIQYITILDLLSCKSKIAKKYNYCRPVIVKEEKKSFLEAKGLRHCLIEFLQQNELYVANDITLGKSDSENGILLYGTNAVGKTSLIRAIGIAVIMAQAGLYVPATEFVFKPYNSIFTRILGNDNIFKGLSTFAVEMTELRNILTLCDENSLILGDELCSGTESTSAISIFVAGVQYLHNKQSSFIFATHLHEIVKYDEITNISEKVKLKHMEVIYDKESDSLIYDRKLRDGAGANTYGLEVCKSLNLPDEFISAAHEIRMKYNPETASILSLKSSQYNSKKLVGLCERCGENVGTEIHHLQHQSDSNENGIIERTDNSGNLTNIFHKNHLANLFTTCKKCHDEMHKESETGHVRIKTTKGTRIKKNDKK